MKYRSVQKLSQKQIQALGADLSEGNEKIVETAGFVPLDVKLRRFQEAGQRLMFHESEFTSNDYREMYFSPDLEITPEMDYEEIQDVMIKRQEFAKSVQERKSKSNGKDVSGGTEDPEKNSEKAAKAANLEAADEVAAE